MKASLQIVDATREDVPALVRLYELSGLDAAGAHDVSRAFESWDRMRVAVPGSRVLIARDGDRAIGTLTLFLLPLLTHGGAPECLVESVAVDPASQGVSVGRELIEAAMSIATEAGCYKLALSSNLKREGAHAFYDALGFERHGFSFVVPLKEAR
jgi:GNAT superfamily N-acetyltransferase